MIQTLEDMIEFQGYGMLHRVLPSFFGGFGKNLRMRHKGVGKFFPRPGQNIISLFLCFPELQAQTSAALGTAAGQNLAAVLGSHAAAKTVDLGAMTLVGLIGTNHVDTS